MTLAKQSLMLFWLQVKMRIGISAMKYYSKHDKKKFRMNIFIIISIIYGLCALLFVYGLIYRAVVKSALALGLGSLILAVTVLAAMIMVFLFGTFQINAMVFNAKDIEWYACLPLKPAAVFASKFGMVYLYELLTVMFILIPAYLLYAIEAGAGAVFWLTAVFTLPLVPVIPLSLSSALALPLSKLSSRFRRRELITTIFTLVIVGVFVAAELAISGLMRNITADSDILNDLLANAEPLLKRYTSMFPPAAWLSSALTMSSGAVSSLLLFAGTSVLIFALALYLSGKFYYAGTLAILETPKAKSKKASFRASHVKSSGAVTTLAMTELKLIFRCPVYLINSLSGIYFAVMILVMPLMLKSQWDELKDRAAEAISSASPALMLVIVSLVLIAAGMINPAASTAVSRAGRSFWIFQTIPVSPRVQITAKLISATGISVASTILVAVCGCIVLPDLLPFAVTGLAPAVLTCVSTSAFSMVPDVISPKLKWDSEAEAIKQNMSALWGMLLAVCPALVMVLPLVPAFALPGMNLTFMLALMIIMSGGTAFGCVYLLRWIADSRFNALAEKL